MDDRPGPGERAERARTRRYWTISAALALVGAGAGTALVWFGDDGSRGLPADWAVAFTLFYLVGFVAGNWFFFRHTDEVDLRDNLIASTAGIYFYATVYPGWYFLWKGGLLAEPDHQLLFIGTMAVIAIAYFWKKFRP